MRISPYFGSSIHYLEYNNLGKHRHGKGSRDKIGMLYTSKGGYIDLGHVRESADRTFYASKITLENLIKGEKEFSFRMIESAKYIVKINYPDYWNKIGKDKQEKIAKEVSIDLGAYLSRISTIWHEIITWYGYSYVKLFSEQVSSFSWEDIYSDVLGAKLGALALRDPARSFDDSMTLLINKALKILGVQSPEIARSATQKIEGKWFTGVRYPFITMKKRNFDVGFDDGVITPWCVPGICPSAVRNLCPVPNLDRISRYGFSIELEIKPRELHKKEVLRIIYPNGEGKRLQPEIHFPIIVEHIKNEARKKYPEVGNPIL